MSIIAKAIAGNWHITQNERLQNQDWQMFKREVAGKKLFLFGAGGGAQYFYDHYIGEYTVEGIIDNNIGIHGACAKDVLGNWNEEPYASMKISASSILQEYVTDAVVLITSLRYYQPISEQLEQEGIFNYFALLPLEAKRKSKTTIDQKEDSISLYLQVAQAMPIENKKLVFYTMGSYSGHGKAIAEKLLCLRNDLDIVWLVDDLKAPVSKDIRVIYAKNKERYLYEISTAKMWIMDGIRVPQYLNKRPGQIYVQTKHWSSITLKTFVLRLAEFRNNQNSIDRCRHNTKMMDYLLTGSDFDEHTCREGFAFEGKMVRVGSPRSDILFHKNECQTKIEKHYHLNGNNKFALYAPTFRREKNKTDVFYAYYDLDFNRLKCALEERFGEEWTILLRLHPLVAIQQQKVKLPEGVVAVSDYHDSQELVAASDLMITDYSSIMFEPAFVRRPVFLFAPDRREYINGELELLIDYDTLPFSVAESNQELAWNVRNFNYEEYVRKVDAFMEKYGVHEDGHASERAAKFLSDLIDGREG